MNAAVALDHAGVAARDLPPLAAAYERLGFTLTPPSRQSGRRAPDRPVEPYGTGNRCAFFRHGYIELIAVLDPARFDIGRGNARDHLAFSAGIHYCVGAGLARMEAQIGLRALAERFPGLRFSGRPVRRDLQTLRGYEHLPVTLR